jgi:hypothetical protein
MLVKIGIEGRRDRGGPAIDARGLVTLLPRFYRTQGPPDDSGLIERGNRLWCWLWSNGHHDVEPIRYSDRGTGEVRRRYAVLHSRVERVCARNGCLCAAMVAVVAVIVPDDVPPGGGTPGSLTAGAGALEIPNSVRPGPRAGVF